MRKIKAIVCAAAIALSLCGSAEPTGTGFLPDDTAAAAAESQGQVWDGTADTSWYYKEHIVLTGESSAEGEEAARFAVFNISTAEELAGLAKLVRNGNDMKNVIINLTADIVLNDTSNFAQWDEQPPANNWTAIGAVPVDAPNEGYQTCRNTIFAGTFNGNGHTITGMYSMHHNYAGLFARVSGAITSVVVKDSYVKCTNTQKTSGGGTALWDTFAGGIAASCERGMINRCSFDGKVFASGQNLAGYGAHGCYAGGIAGKFTDDDQGVAAVVFAFCAAPIGVLFNPVIFTVADGSNSMIQDPGIYNCMNTGTVYAENGTGENGAGGIVGTGGLYTFKNPDFAVFYCLNTGEITANHENVGGMVGNGYKFSEQKSYYTNCTRSSQNDAAVNFTEAGMDLQEVAEVLGSAYQYKDGEISLNFDGLQMKEPEEALETEQFSPETPEKQITMPAPEVTCSFLTHYFGTVVDQENIAINISKNENIAKWAIDVAGDPGFTDIYANESTLYDIPTGKTYYIRVQGRTVSDQTDPDCAYTAYRYLNFTIQEDGTLAVKEGLNPSENPGDANADGTFDLADVIALQKWLLAVPDAVLADWKAADINQDSRIDGLDLAIMRQMLTQTK